LIPLLTLPACIQSQDGGGAIVQAYLQALVDGNKDRMISLTCGDFQAEAILEFDSFQGVKSSLENVTCKQTGGDEKTKEVTCTGKISATYGNEIQEFDLSSQTYRLNLEGQEWLICGRE